MQNTLNSETKEQQMVYQIKLEGRLSSQWTDWFGNVTITQDDNGNTLLTSTVVDQPELYGLLRKVRDLGMPLLSVTRITPDVKQ